MTDFSPAANEGMHAYIHEAQVSIMVTGIDDWVWTAYCFVDVYFKNARHSQRVQQLSNPPVRRDPHSCGKHSAEEPKWLPREYFLRSLQARMHQVTDEWENSVSELKKQIEPYVRLCNPPLKT
jgi:hypothetical protein